MMEKVKENKLWEILAVISFVIALLINIFVKQQEDVNTKPYKVLLILVISLFLILGVISRFNLKLKKTISYKAQFYTAIGVVLSIWDILTEKAALLPLPFFPSLAQICQVMKEDVKTLLVSTAFSLRLLVVGFILGTILGLVTGVLIGWYKQWDYWLFPIVKIIGVIPATAWIPIVMFVFPSSFWAQVFLIILCVWFPVAFMTSGGIENLPKSYFETARTLGAKESFLIFKVAIPGAMPSIFTGIYTATGVSFATLVVSEMIGAKAGLGWYINWAKGWSNYAKVYASIIIMGIVFSIVLALIFKIRNRVLIWQKGLMK